MHCRILSGQRIIVVAVEIEHSVWAATGRAGCSARTGMLQSGRLG
jgi:hypothetical protein